MFRSRWEAATADISRHMLANGIYSEEDVMRLCDEFRTERRAANAARTAAGTSP